MGKPTVGYWDLRGLAEPIRYLLHYKNVDFEDKRYISDNAEVWFEKDKFSLGLDFPNLPYYIDENVKLTQSTTILRYLARKYDLDGKTEQEKLSVSLGEQQILDFRTNFIRMCYNENFETLKPEFLKNVPSQLKLIETFLGSTKFLAADCLTYVDFMAYDTFEFYTTLIPNLLDGFQSLKAYQERIRNLPTLQKYFKSPVYKRWPILGPYAQFGGKGPEPNK